MAITIPTTGMEYTIVPDGNILGTQYPGSDQPYTWVPIDISYASCVPISGYRILARYRVVNVVVVPPTGSPGDSGYDPGSTTYNVFYPFWNLIDQTLTCTSHTGNLFQQVDALFVNQAEDNLGVATAGITEDSCYNYFAVFDQSQSGYIERLSSYDSLPIEDSIVPTLPYNESEGIYPIDALTKFIPDSRRFVTVQYELSTTYNLGLGGVDVTDVVGISHTVTQSTDDWSNQVKSMVSKSYLYNGVRPYRES